MSKHDPDADFVVQPLAVGMEPTAEERELRKRVHDMAAAFGPDRFAEAVASGESRHELWRALGAEGLLGAHLPTEHGGAGGGLMKLAAVLEECARAGVPMTPGIFSSAVAALILVQHGTQAQRSTWLPGIGRGEKIICFAMTETDAGLNPASLSTTATRAVDGSWVLEGTKSYVTGMSEGGAVLVVARTSEPTGLTLFLLDSGSPGIVADAFRTEVQVPERSARVTFTGVRAPADSVVGIPGKGLQAAFAGMNAERILTSAISTGLGRYALTRATERARTRRVWSAPLGAHQAVAHPLARAHIALESAQLMARRAIALYDAGADAAAAANAAKITGAAAGLQALDAAIQTFGGAGVQTAERLAGYWFLVRSYQLGPVPDELALNLVAERVLGLPRSYE